MPSLPSSPASGKQRTVVLNENLFVYTSTTTAYRTSVSNPASIQWGNLITISGLPSDAKLTSIINFNNRLYTTEESGKAFYSDNGTNWEEMDIQGMHMVTFLAGIPEDKVTGNENTLTGIFAKDGKNFFCAKNLEETTWRKGEEEVSTDFPLKEIYSTVFTNASGIKQTVVVGNVEETVEATIPWFSMDGLVWVDMSTPTDFSCPAMKNPAIMYYGSQFHAIQI